MKDLSFLLLVCIFLLAVSSCSEDCNSTATNIVKIKFYTKKPVKENRISFDSIYGVGLKKNLVKDAELRSIYSLPVRSDANETSFVLKKGAISNTITFKYNTLTFIEGRDCGYKIFYSDLDTVGTSFDSVVVVNKTLFSTDTVHVQIFNN